MPRDPSAEIEHPAVSEPGQGARVTAANAPTGGLIPQLAPLAFDQVIIAGGDDDVSAEELFDWVAPLLAGIPGGRWMSCQLDTGDDGRLVALYRNGVTRTAVSISLDVDAPAIRSLLRQLPEARSVTVILLSDVASQAVMLLDSVARWLNIYDVDEESVAPVVRLLGSFHTVVSRA